MTEVVTIKPFKTSERPKIEPQRAVQTVRISKSIVPQQSEQKPEVEKDLSQRTLWGWLLPNGVNCPHRGHIKCSKELYS